MKGKRGPVVRPVTCGLSTKGLHFNVGGFQRKLALSVGTGKAHFQRNASQRWAPQRNVREKLNYNVILQR
jgi:hypothetical protein